MKHIQQLHHLQHQQHLKHLQHLQHLTLLPIWHFIPLSRAACLDDKTLREFKVSLNQRRSNASRYALKYCKYFLEKLEALFGKYRKYS